jgi:dihydroorotase-like cyclic amidohydrolase
MIGKQIDIEADVTIDAKGKLVIPGGIDPPHAYGIAVWRDAVVG